MKPEDLKKGDLVGGKYRLIEPVDRKTKGGMKRTGAFGFLYKAEDTDSNGNYVVIKFFDEKKVEDAFENLEFNSKDVVDRLLRIVKEIKKSNNKHILYPISEKVEEYEGITYYVMPYCKEGDLSKDLEKHKVPNEEYDEEVLLNIIHDVADGLSAIHKAGRVHHDIKPSNILINGGDFLITDLDFTAPESEKKTNTDKKKKDRILKIRTKEYASPQIYDENEEVLASDDIWALGVTVYELAYSLPKKDTPYHAVDFNGYDTKKYSSDFNNIVKLCLQEEREKRPTADKIVDMANEAISRSKHRIASRLLADNICLIEKESNVWHILDGVANGLVNREKNLNEPYGGIGERDILIRTDGQGWVLHGNTNKELPSGHTFADDIATLGACMKSLTDRQGIYISPRLRKTLEACQREEKRDRPTAVELAGCAKDALQSSNKDWWWINHEHRDWEQEKNKNHPKKANRALLVAVLAVLAVIAVVATVFSSAPSKVDTPFQPFHDEVTYTHDSCTEIYGIDRTDENIYRIEFQKSSSKRKHYDGQARKNPATGHWELNGNGILVNEDGTWFEGEFANDNPYDGTYHFPNGKKYVGTFKDGCYYDGIAYNKDNKEDGRYVKGEWIGKK